MKKRYPSNRYGRYMNNEKKRVTEHIIVIELGDIV